MGALLDVLVVLSPGLHVRLLVAHATLGVGHWQAADQIGMHLLQVRWFAQRWVATARYGYLHTLQRVVSAGLGEG